MTTGDQQRILPESPDHVITTGLHIMNFYLSKIYLSLGALTGIRQDPFNRGKLILSSNRSNPNDHWVRSVKRFTILHMTTDNERFKTILHDARLICLNKLQQVQAQFGKEHTEVAALESEMNAVIGHFDNPALWLNPIPFDEMEITTYITQVDATNPGDLPSFKENVRNFIAYLNDQVLKAPISSMESNNTSDFNLKVLDALTQCQRNIGGRKVFFKNQGTDLDNDPAFQEKQNEQRPAMDRYREALKTNEVQSVESDWIIFNRISEAIRQATVLVQFFAIYDLLTKTIKSKLPPEKEV